MLSALFPQLWRVEPTASTANRALAIPKDSKVHVAAASSLKPNDQKKTTAKLSVNDRLRALINDMITEEELQKRFTFGRMLGSGATSKVFAAVDTQTGQEVAIKVFDKASMIETRRSMVADGDYVVDKAVHRVRRRLLKIVSEVEISKSLDHPNIIKYLGAYETSHRICIVHELVEGSDLLEHLLTHGKMAEDKAAFVFKQLLSALHYCHDRHIYHRDLKLENVLITPDYHVKLIDFGLSEIVYPGEMLKTICGTPLYCSPEMLFLQQSNRNVGFHGGPADVWSVGVLIFALLTGCAPFDDSNFTRLRRDVYRNIIPYPNYISDEVKGLLKALLVHDAQLRPTVKDILEFCWFQKATENSTSCSELNCPDGAESSSRCRSLSVVSDNGTASSSHSLEDPIQSLQDRKTSEQPQCSPISGHLSCLEKA